MSRVTRRNFVQGGAAALTAAAWMSSAKAQAQVAGSNERIRIAVIGCGGQAKYLMKAFSSMPDNGSVVTHVCDVDKTRLEGAVKHVEDISKAHAARLNTVAPSAPTPVDDLRKVLDNHEVDAVVIGTPDHWHGPATILACDAGKHVYVEKPCSHNLREGRLMIEAARRNKRVVQVGTQSRSLPHILEAIEMVRGGAIGQVLQTKAWTNQMRANIGHKTPTDPPAQLNYDAWVGPASFVPYRSNCSHYTWRWWHSFGTGDIGNDGAHELDVARWALGVETHPTTITASGGKMYFDDDQEFPDTYSVVYDYPGESGKVGERRQLVFELRNWCQYGLDGYENGAAFYGTKGMMIVGKDVGWTFIGKDEKFKQEKRIESDPSPHQRNFLETIRSGGKSAADIEVGHLSTSLAHLGNIAVRVGRTLHFDPTKETFIDDKEASSLIRREYRDGHWAIPKGV